MNIFWAIIIWTNVELVEVWQTREPCVRYAKEIENAICVPVSVENKHEIENQIVMLNQLLK